MKFVLIILASLISSCASVRMHQEAPIPQITLNVFDQNKGEFEELKITGQDKETKKLKYKKNPVKIPYTDPKMQGAICIVDQEAPVFIKRFKMSCKDMCGN